MKKVQIITSGHLVMKKRISIVQKQEPEVGLTNSIISSTRTKMNLKVTAPWPIKLDVIISINI